MNIHNRFAIFFMVLFFIFGSLTLVYGDDREKSRKHLKARLNGFQEVPAVSTVARGLFTAKIDHKAKEVSYRLSYHDLEGEVLQAHVHFGQRKVNGGVIAFLCANGDVPVPQPMDVSIQACPQSGTIEGTITEEDVLGPANQGIEPGEFEEFVNA